MRIVACGDALFSSRNLAGRLDRRLLAALADADATFANAEFCCPKPDTPPMPRRFQTAVSPRALDELAALGVNLVSFANNHTGDFGPQGVRDTIEAAEARDLAYAGIGASLAEARSARFLDTPNGRVALVAASTTRSAEFLASIAGKGIAPRPGLNPLRWGRAYVLPDDAFRQLQQIEAALGLTASRQEVLRAEVVADSGPDKFAFGSFFEGSVPIERGATAHVRSFADARDVAAILENIRDGANRSDCLLLSLHCHEGTGDNWYAPRVAAFIEDFARQAIDAGAAAVLGHGPHMLRGIELYRGRPIFYSLNSLLMEFEAGEQRMTPEMFSAYGFAPDALPSQLHVSRVHDASGQRIGFYGEARFSKACAAVCDIDDGAVRVKLVPIDLGLGSDRATARGLPSWADPQLGREIADDLTTLSQYYGTIVKYDAADGTLAVASA
jgi:poly-gamma-glutamate synthesis protein (capsule biosynthesis protein)